MRILIVSDTHKREDNLINVLEKDGPFDLLIHCGDVEGSEYEIKEYCGCEAVMIAGNNDFFSELPDEVEFSLFGRKVWVTHGHSYLVSMGSERISDEAIAKDVDIVMFGHTHRPFLDITDDLTMLNPGSISYPRQQGREPSYIIMKIEDGSEPEFEIKHVESD